MGSWGSKYTNVVVPKNKAKQKAKPIASWSTRMSWATQPDESFGSPVDLAEIRRAVASPTTPRIAVGSLLSHVHSSWLTTSGVVEPGASYLTPHTNELVSTTTPTNDPDEPLWVRLIQTGLAQRMELGEYSSFLTGLVVPYIMEHGIGIEVFPYRNELESLYDDPAQMARDLNEAYRRWINTQHQPQRNSMVEINSILAEEQEPLTDDFDIDYEPF